MKARTKWRDTKRAPRKSRSEAETERPALEAEPEAETAGLAFIASITTRSASR